MRKERAGVKGLLAVSLLLLALPAFADDEVQGDGQPAKASLAERIDYWEGQRIRPFVTTKLALGLASSAQAFAGYGRPKWMWAGASTNVLLTSDMLMLSAGPQIELLLLNALFRINRVEAFRRRLPVIQDVYFSEDLEDRERSRAAYTSLTASFWGLVPAGPTLGMWSVGAEHIFGLSPDTAVFSEQHRFVVNNGQSMMPQLVWWLLLDEGRYMIGPAFDAVLSKGRQALLRAGGSAVVRFGPHLTLQCLLTFPVSSLDQIGWVTQSWGTVRLEWSWASGEPTPAFL